MTAKQAESLSRAAMEGKGILCVAKPGVVVSGADESTFGLAVAVCGKKSDYADALAVEAAVESVRSWLIRAGIPYVIQTNPGWMPNSAFAVW